ncbi:MAG: hypothetical protein ACI37T_04570 [Candidatus Gastranaerophilaceae bacterium]
MIYKCKNCGQNYSEKPDFCECGNNVFVVLKTVDNTNSAVSERYIDDFNVLYPEDNSIGQDNIFEDYDNTKTLTVFSIVLFAISLIISSFFIYKAVIYTPNLSEKHIASNDIIVENIPLVDSYWEDGHIAQKDSKYNINNAIENIIFETKKINKKPTSLISELTPKSANNTTYANSDLSAKNSSKKKSAEIKVRQQVVEIPKNVTTKKNIESLKDIDKNTNSDIDKKVKSNNENIRLQEKNIKVDTEKQDESDLLRYKADLRLSLFRFFPVLNVYGYGVAVIGFNISEDGKLNNRRFIQQSDNKSLNDAMYHMLMNMPIYNPPPKSYKGEDIALKMEFNNGYYSFSFVE